MKRLVLLVFGLLSVFGCTTVKQNSYKWETMSRDEVFNFLYYSNHVSCAGGPVVNQGKYCIPTVDWVNNVYAPFLKQFLFDNGVNSPNIDDNNCVKFSTYGQAAGYILHYAKKEGPAGTTLAIGVTDYSTGLFTDAHSINFFIAVDKNGNKIIYYFEPQIQSAAGNAADSNWWFVRM